jgi:TRAP-type mannitol/chloroaromatic compound transport system substrate-binding protein
VVPQQIAGGEIYPALEKGTLDACEWVGPYDDEKLGFQKVAQYYYYPGWWEGGPMLNFLVNVKQWDSLPKTYQAAIEAACAESNVLTMAKYDNLNPPALRRLIANGAVLKPLPRDVLEAAFKASRELYAETSANNPQFKKVYEAWSAYLTEQVRWFSVAEGTFDRAMTAQIAKQ